MFVLLEVLPHEADTGTDDYLGVEVIAASPSRDELELFLARYRVRHRAACREFDTWDKDKGADWGPEHDAKFDELCDKYDVTSLIADVTFKIVESEFNGAVVE